ncbi:hypothetical protein QYF36_015590 [Acer negundo]|nr:hypothetical protein QYF36_015590 [Acer negundo]
MLWFLTYDTEREKGARKQKSCFFGWKAPKEAETTTKCNMSIHEETEGKRIENATRDQPFSLTLYSIVFKFHRSNRPPSQLRHSWPVEFSFFVVFVRRSSTLKSTLVDQ